MAPYDDIRPFSIAVSDDRLHKLRAKLDLTQLPDELELPVGQEWEWGTPLAVVKPLVEYWRTEFDWRAVEAKINQTLPQFTTYVDSLEHGPHELHFVHKRSEHSGATPLLFVHGWPGSFLEVSKIIDDLTNPKDPKHPAFHVVAPSLPGYAFSQSARTPGMGHKATAYIFDKLMTKLGYKYYMAQGGDWGSLVVRALAVFHQDTCLATHQNLNATSIPTPLRNPLLTLKIALGYAGLPGGYSKADMDKIKNIQTFMETGNGYSRIQETRPQTLAFALADSPVGLLAWIAEKLHAWSHNYPWTPEETITWVMIYWINGPAASLRYYKENGVNMPPRDPKTRAVWDHLRTTWSPTLYAFSDFPGEAIRLPLDWCGLNQNLVYAKSHDRGGHYAAWEVPELLLGDIREFTRIVHTKEPRLISQ